MAKKNATKLSADELAAAEREAELAAEEFDREPTLDELLTGEEVENAAPFYFVLRSYVKQLKEARTEAGLKLADVAARSDLAIESLSRLETGTATNPTWKTLGMYAKAVGRRPFLVAIPIAASLAPMTPYTSVSSTNGVASPIVSKPAAGGWAMGHTYLPQCQGTFLPAIPGLES